MPTYGRAAQSEPSRPRRDIAVRWTRDRAPAARPPTTTSSLVTVALVEAVAIAAGSPPPRPEPSVAGPSLTAARPAVQLDETWTAEVDGEWTFTGTVDPQDDPINTILEEEPGPATTRRFGARVPVAAAVTSPGTLTITTRQNPDIDEISGRAIAAMAAERRRRGRSASRTTCPASSHPPCRQWRSTTRGPW